MGEGLQTEPFPPFDKLRTPPQSETLRQNSEQALAQTARFAMAQARSQLAPDEE